MNQLEARRSLLGRNVYKRTTEGNPAIAQGSLARMYPGITMQGWTEQAQYEGKNLFDISDFETNNKGIIENGTILFKQSLGTVTYYLSLSPGTYSISIKRSGFSAINIKVNEVVVINNGASTNFTNNFDVSDGDSVVLEFSEGQNPNGEDRMIYDIMLNSGSTVLPYEPYTGGQPSPNPDYPQEIVSAGEYDEETQKYEYEITIANEQTDPDKNQTVTLTSDRPLTKWDKLEKRGGQWGWVYKSGSYTVTGEERFISAASQYIGSISSDAYFNNNEMVSLPSGSTRETSFCEQLSWYSGIWNGDGKVGYTCHNNQIHMRLLNSDTGVTEVDNLTTVSAKIKAYVAQKYEEGNLFIFWYETTEESFVPLSEFEQEQMNELYTFRPTTVLSNDCDCDMTLTYKTKKSMEVSS